METCLFSYPIIFHLAIFSIIFLLFLSKIIGATNAMSSTDNSYKFKLIHRHSLLHSPHRNSLLPDDNSDFRAGVWADDKNLLFMVNISIGTPPTPQLVAMDLGSSLLWVECNPCVRCSTETSSRYNRFKSSSFSGISCYDRSCFYLSNSECDVITGRCEYILRYEDSTFIKGILATEKLTFTTSNYSTDVRVVKFGCTNDHFVPDGLYPLSGIFGLNYSPLSIIHQLSITRFSYCTATVSDTLYSHNQLALGVSAHIEGDSTKLEIFSYNYYVKFEGISVGDTRLSIDFERTSDNGRAVLDTGATFTYVVEEASKEINKEVHRFMRILYPDIHRISTSDPNGPRLCYSGNIYSDIDNFPRITFHFPGGATLKMDVDSMFKQGRDNTFCLTIESSSRNLIGMMAQQNHNMGFDLATRRLSIRMVECEMLDN